MACPWSDVGPALRRVDRLGHSNLALRVQVACRFVQSLHLYSERAPEAWERWEEAWRRVHRVRRGHFLREEGVAALAHARREARIPRPRQYER